MNRHIIPKFTLLNAFAGAVIALFYIIIFSLIKEPARQKLSAIIVAGAGAVYQNGGLSFWEYIFGTIMIFITFKGLTNYYFTAIGWLLHASWDIVHHLYANPIVPFSPSSQGMPLHAILSLLFGFFTKLLLYLTSLINKKSFL